jgi:hypothetical protein
MEKFLKSLASFIQLIIVILLIQIYFEKWIESYKTKNWLVFVLMSILPTMALYCLFCGVDNPYVEYDN